MEMLGGMLLTGWLSIAFSAGFLIQLKTAHNELESSLSIIYQEMATQANLVRTFSHLKGFAFFSLDADTLIKIYTPYNVHRYPDTLGHSTICTS